MATITIPKIEYEELVDKKLHYDYLKNLIEEDLFSLPPIKDANKVVEELKSTKRYTPSFLSSLKRGLKRSSYFK